MAQDKIAEAPDRIRVAQDADGFWTCREAVSGSQEYIRADHADALTQRVAAAEAESAKLRGLLWYAWHEFNAIRARSGAPLSHDGMPLCTDQWWGEITEAFAAAIGDGATTPWPSPEARAALQSDAAP